MDARTQKYDRQLRLWGSSGQDALESAHILLINATAAGCEILKNLVLPGIGQFTVVDQGTVTQNDIGSNFFLDFDSLGSSRARRACELLGELNEDVKGHWVDKDILTILKEDPGYLAQFSLVVASDVTRETAEKIAGLCWVNGQDVNANGGNGGPAGKRKTTFVWVKTVGLIGAARIAVPEHAIVETHPDNVADLRIDAPFPELSAYAKSFDFNTKDGLEFGHIPYVAILLKYMGEWKQEHGGMIPSTYAEKNQLKTNIKSGMRSADDENFEEAINSVLRSCQPTVVPSAIKDLFNDPKCENLTVESDNFWILARAVRDFVNDPSKSGGLLPLSGTIPDMKAQTDSYVTLQNIYKTKAKQDVQEVSRIVESLLESLGLAPGSISLQEIESFCKYSAFLKVIRYRSLEEEYHQSKTKQISSWLSDPDSVFPFYVLLRASDSFHDDHGRYPGEGEDWEDDVDQLHTNVTTLLQSWGIDKDAISKDLTYEICRYGNGSIHNIASFIGGVVSQEVIKLITHQYIPMDNTFIFDGARSVSSVFAV
ncbi:NEDD8-activating enzyme E1 regulatory subunit-like protein [Gamsiella multidivaricata]|uniref:NEDD8-activating enzyme E1 regulatory subunit-like protein n=1 Tax=Gamsiella multidivaricata TaxID=101098 RepID=UPI00221F52DD|nr:NEDD8-activating enzyme E1 regulatory subunit-like protein [Gamsiella multidivaricata]KAG0357502.1 NEDD8-activating enzyme E1 regulatory subunit [Gamsiella multidivaricata]KAI7818492.1 NEDD8-activating enzyme E1 regulatory subunit-like protein [Gamsiella multidivaricata]